MIELYASDNDDNEYKLEAIYNSAFYRRKLASHLPVLYYLVF